jgi:hypothetical protein
VLWPITSFSPFNAFPLLAPCRQPPSVCFRPADATRSSIPSTFSVDGISPRRQPPIRGRQLDRRDGDREGKQHPEAIARIIKTTARLRERHRSRAIGAPRPDLSIIDNLVPLRPGKAGATLGCFGTAMPTEPAARVGGLGRSPSSFGEAGASKKYWPNEHTPQSRKFALCCSSTGKLWNIDRRPNDLATA